MAGPDELHSIADNPTGIGDEIVVSTAQVENLARPGGRSFVPPANGDTPKSNVGRPGGRTGGAKAETGYPEFARPGGAQGV